MILFHKERRPTYTEAFYKACPWFRSIAMAPHRRTVDQRLCTSLCPGPKV